MSGGHFHVHGPHDHHVEHAAHGAHGNGDGFASRIAVLTAVLSTIGALFGYMGGHTQNEALLLKNEAAIQKTSASNQWNYYQAKSNKQNLAELSVVLTQGEAREKFIQDIERYKKEKNEIKADAEKLEAAAKEADKKSELEMHVHGRWALATTLLQISIALAAIALLTRKRWLLTGVYGASAVGLVIAGMGFLHL
jgi:cytochrome c556